MDEFLVALTKCVNVAGTFLVFLVAILNTTSLGGWWLLGTICQCWYAYNILRIVWKHSC